MLIKLQHLLVSQIHGIYFLAQLNTSGENRFSAPTVIFHFKYCLNFRRICNGNPAGDSEVTLSTEKEEGWRNGAWLKQAFVHKLTSAIRKMDTVPPCVFKIWNSFLTASRCCLPLGFLSNLNQVRPCCEAVVLVRFTVFSVADVQACTIWHRTSGEVWLSLESDELCARLAGEQIPGVGFRKVV